LYLRRQRNTLILSFLKSTTFFWFICEHVVK
jgi:hypothetical protein